MALPDILYRGSAKNLRGKPGVSPYILEFSDRYSVYEWGEMPDEIQGKATALAFLAWFFFDHLGNPASWQDASLFPGLADDPQLRQLAQQGLPHHMIGLAGGDLRPLTLDREILSPSKHLLVRALSYPMIEDDNVTAVGPDRVLPLALRFEIAGKGARPGVTLHACGASCTVLSTEEAAVKCGLPVSEMTQLCRLAELTAMRLAATFDGIGIRLTAGKLQFAVTGGEGGRREFMLVDSLGPDDLALEAGGVRLSQDVLEHSYRGSVWHTSVERAKQMAAEREERDWKRICLEELKAHPPLLSPIVKEKAAMVYKSLAKALCERHHGKPVFANAWDVSRVIESLSARKAAA